MVLQPSGDLVKGNFADSGFSSPSHHMFFVLLFFFFLCFPLLSLAASGLQKHDITTDGRMGGVGGWDRGEEGLG